MSDSHQEPTSLAVDGPAYKERVAVELFKMRTRKDAIKKLNMEEGNSVVIPEGVLADGPLPDEPSELIDGILLTHGATGIIGAKEVGKSLVALEIQQSLLTGSPLWGAIKPNATVEKTVHILAEHTSSTLMGLYHRLGMPGTGRLRIFGPEHLGVNKLLVSSGIRREQAVSFYKRLVKGAGLVVFDPIASFIQGQSAENDNSPMRNLIDTMIEIAQSTGAACLVLGHQGKPIIFQGRTIRRSSYATRGASSTEDSLTAVHYLNPLDGQKFGKNDVFELRPIHFKGRKRSPFKIIRNSVTCKHVLATKALSTSGVLDALLES